MIHGGRRQRQRRPAIVQMMLGESMQSPHMGFGPPSRSVPADRPRIRTGKGNVGVLRTHDKASSCMVEGYSMAPDGLFLFTRCQWRLWYRSRGMFLAAIQTIDLSDRRYRLIQNGWWPRFISANQHACLSHLQSPIVVRSASLGLLK